MKERNSTFDIMKGIAMLLVIASHTYPSVSPPFAFWRSAMFFVISGYFAKEWPVGEFLKKGAKRLFIPYVATCLVMLLIVFVSELIFDAEIFPIALKSMMLGTAEFGYDGKYREICIGPLWFVSASIWVRLMWAILQKINNLYIRGGVIFLFALLSCNLKEMTVNPWSILNAFGALGFFFAGFLVRKYDLLNSIKGKTLEPLFLVALFFCISFSKLDINFCDYGKSYLLDVLASVGAFMLLYACVNHFADVTLMPWKILNFIGRYSLVIFCLHAVDDCLNVHWLPFKIWDWFSTGFELLCAFVIKAGFVVGGAYLISKNKFLKERIFFIK